MANDTMTGVPLDPEEVKASSAKRRAVASAALPDKVHTWPYLVRAEFISGIILIAFLLAWSIFVDAPMEEPANPANTPNPSKAPWYFLGLQELLVYFDPWIAGVMLPTMIITGLMAIPYVDTNPKGNGYYTFKERWFSISVFFFGFFGLWVIPIVLGVFFRGPGWNIYMPWEYWDPHRVVAMTNVDFTYLLGVRSYAGAMVVGGAVVMGYLGTSIMGPWVLFKDKPFFKELGFVRWIVVGSHLSIMFGVVLKMILRLGFSVKYIWVTPFFNI